MRAFRSGVGMKNFLIGRQILLAAAVSLAMILCAQAAVAQLQFTEVMYEPGGDDALWEWVEVRNTSAAAINLDGWIFDDDDDVPVSAAAESNIKAANGNTIVPANGGG